MWRSARLFRLQERRVARPARFLPGSHAGRWIALLLVGILVGVLGIDYLLVSVYRDLHFPSWAVDWVQDATLQFAPRALRGAVFLLIGVAAVVYALRRYGNPLNLR
jgi:hypothetical protein